MYMLIVGGGGIGEALTSRVLREYRGIKVTLIDIKDKVCERISRRYPMVNVICGDATDPHVLEEAEVSEADVFIAVSGDDKVNIMSALLAKKLDAKKIIVRVKNTVYEELAYMLGIEYVINPAKSAAAQIDAIIRTPGLVDLLEIARRDVEMFELKVGEDSQYAGRRLAETPLYLDDNTAPVLIFRGGDILLPKPHIKVEVGDKILVVRKKSGLLSHILYR